jgi:uncharacterized protein YggE
VRGLLVTGVVLLALAVAYLVGAGSGPGTPAVAAADPEPAADPGALVMTGTGSVAVVPDQVSFTVAVAATRPGLDAALDAANGSMDRALARLRAYGVTGRRVQTTGLAMDPVYDYPRYGSPVLRGYRVGQTVRATVPDLRKAGAAITAVVEGGGNAVRVRGIRLEVGDRSAALEEARDAAVAEATAKAEQYAAAAGQDLGAVLSLREVRASTPRPAYPVNAEYDRALKAVPLRAGTDRQRVTVRLEWAFG